MEDFWKTWLYWTSNRSGPYGILYKRLMFFLSSTLLELRKMCMTGFSSWRFLFKSGLKGEGEAVDVFVNFPKFFSWAPYSLSSETHKGRDELFPSCIWQMLLIYIQSLQRQSTHCHDFLYNLDANPFPRLQVYYYQISCAHSGLNILWSLKMSKIHYR